MFLGLLCDVPEVLDQAVWFPTATAKMSERFSHGACPLVNLFE